MIRLFFRPFKSSQRPPRRRPIRSRLRTEELESRLAPSVNVLTFHNDIASTGLNAGETQLTPSNVQVGSFGKLFATPVDGQIYAEPLIDTGISIANSVNTRAGAAGVHDVVFVATEHDSLYAIDSKGGAILWQRSFLDLTNPTGDINNTLGATAITTVPYLDVENSGFLTPEIGITGTPVIDASTNLLYVVVMTKETIAGQGHYVQRLHAIKLSDGTDAASPVLIGDTTTFNGFTHNTPIYVYGSGDGSVPDPYNGTGKPVVQFNASRQLQRSALSLVNHEVYVNWASIDDINPYHGWVVVWDVFNVTTSGFQMKGVFNDSPNDGGSGIWEGGGRLVFEANGSAFCFETGNGSGGAPTLNANGFPTDANYKNAVVKMVADPTTSPTNQNPNGWGLKVADYFIPYNTATLDASDTDLGSGGILLLPDSVGLTGHPHLMVAAGKEGKIYLIDRDNLGHFDPNNDHVVNAVPDGSGHNTPPFLLAGALSTAAFFNGSFYWVSGYSSSARAFAINSSGTLSVTSQTATNTFGSLPGSVVVSANGTNGGIVWVMDRNLNQIHAYDATNLATELWNSGQKSAGADALGAVVKFAVPTVANGEVYVGTADSLVVYGLLNLVNAVPNPPVLSAMALSVSSIGLTWTDSTQAPNTAAGYKIEQSTDNVNFSQVATAPAGATSITIGGLASQTTYYFRIRGFNSLGNSNYSNTASVTTNPLATTTTTVTSSANPQTVGQPVSWTATVSAAATGPVNFVDFETGDFSQTATHTASGTAIVTSPTLDGTYALRLQRSNSFANVEIRQSGTTYYSLPTAYYQFLFEFTSNPLEGGIVNFQDTASGFKAALHLSADDKLLFYDSTGTLRGSGSTALSAGQVYVLSAKIGTGPSASWEIRINGTVEMSGSNNLGAGNNGSLKLGGNALYTATYYYDDVAISSQAYAGPVPTGTVQFMIDGVQFGGPVMLNSGVATSQTTSSLASGSHAITAVYSGDTNFSGSTGMLTQMITGAATADTTTTVTSSANPQTAGQPVSWTATVTPAAGFVNWVNFETGDFSQTASHTASGAALVTSPALDGIYSLQLQRSNSIANVEIRQSGTSYYNLPTAYYQFLFEYTANSGEGGIVNFQDTASGFKAALHLSADDKLLFYDSTGTLRGSGSTALSAGQVYVLSAKIGTGPSASWEIRINGTVEMSGSNNLGAANNGSLKLGGNALYTATYYYDDVAINSQGYPGPVPTGTVQFAIDGTNFGTPVMLSNGMATSPATSALAAGNHVITARYSGDNTYAASNGTLANGQTINAPSGQVNFVDFETGDFSQTASHTPSGAALVTSPALDGIYSLQLQRSNSIANVEIRQSGTSYYNLPTAYYQFLFEYTANSGEGGIVNFQDTASGFKAALHLSADDKLLFYDSTGTLRGSGSTALSAGQVYVLSAKIGTGPSASWEIRINGTVEMSGSNNLGAANNGSLKLGGNLPYTATYYYDDVAINSQGYPGGGAASRRRSWSVPPIDPGSTSNRGLAWVGSGNVYAIPRPAPLPTVSWNDLPSNLPDNRQKQGTVQPAKRSQDSNSVIDEAEITDHTETGARLCN